MSYMCPVHSLAICDMRVNRHFPSICILKWIWIFDIWVCVQVCELEEWSHGWAWLLSNRIIMNVNSQHMYTICTPYSVLRTHTHTHTSIFEMHIQLSFPSIFQIEMIRVKIPSKCAYIDENQDPVTGHCTEEKKKLNTDNFPKMENTMFVRSLPK